MNAQQSLQTYVYVSLRGENAIAIYSMDGQTGGLIKIKTEPVTGGPASLALDPGKQFLYVAQRSSNSISAYQVDAQTGLLTLINSIKAVDNPVYISVDKTGNYLLSAYFNANKAAVYAISKSGALSAGALQTINTGTNPHAVMTDPSNNFAYIPAMTGDKIEISGFDNQTGFLSAGSIPPVITRTNTGPRHFTFHGSLNLVYFVNQKSNSITVYRLNPLSGALDSIQNLSTIPASYTGTNASADIHLTPDSRFLYASNRGHESIAAFSTDPVTGTISLVGYYSTEKSPREFDIDPSGNFLFAAGESSGQLASYRINQVDGSLEKLNTYIVGKTPSWVLAVSFKHGEPTVNVPACKENVNKVTVYPNPAGNCLYFNYELTKNTPVTIDLFHVSGKAAAFILNEEQIQGNHTCSWNIPSGLENGLYYCLFRAGNYTSINQVCLFR